MRWTLLVAALLLAGCVHPPAASPTTGVGAAPNAHASASGPAAASAGSVPLRFAGAPVDTNATYSDTFPPTDWCDLRCTSAAHTRDLTSSIPVGVPVHLTADVTGTGSFSGYLATTDVSYNSYRSTSDAAGFHLAVDILRGASSTVGLALLFYGPNGPDASPSPTLQVQVRVQADPLHVPPGQPVALALKPGDRVNATGAAVKGLFLVGPGGTVQHITRAPFTAALPADAKPGTYVAIPYGDGPATLSGPAQALAARRYQFHSGQTHDLPAGQKTEWDESIPALPVLVGFVVDCKQVASQGCDASFRGNGDYALAAPDGASAFHYAEGGCTTLCDLTAVAGYFQNDWFSDFLAPHLAAGTFHATANVQQGNSMQAAVAWITIE